MVVSAELLLGVVASGLIERELLDISGVILHRRGIDLDFALLWLDFCGIVVGLTRIITRFAKVVLRFSEIFL